MIQSYERETSYYGHLQGKKVAILGYDEAAREEIKLLLDKGIDVVVGLRRVDDQWEQVIKDGFQVMTLEDAVKDSEVIQVW